MNNEKPWPYKIYRVIGTPQAEDPVASLPWEYTENSFIRWVDEVFLEGYKKGEDAPFPSPEEALNGVREAGYTVEFEPTMKVKEGEERDD